MTRSGAPRTSSRHATVAQRRPYTPRMPAEERRDQLRDAALQIIARDGYAAVSIDAIAREVGVTRPVVYNVFDGLDSLLHSLLDRQEKRAVEQILATVSGPPDLRNLGGYLRRTITDLAGMVAADPLTWKPILLASVDTPAAVRRRIEHDRDVVRTRFQALVELILVSRTPSPGVDPALVSHALIAIAEHFGRMILEDPGSVDADRLASTIATLFLPGRRG